MDSYIKIIIGIFLVFTALYTYIFEIQRAGDIYFIANVFSGIVFIISGIYSLIKRSSSLNFLILSAACCLSISFLTNIILVLSEDFEPSNNYCYFLLRYINPLIVIAFYSFGVIDKKEETNFKTLWLINLPIFVYSIIYFFISSYTELEINDGLFNHIFSNSFFDFAFVIMVYLLTYGIGAFYIFLNRRISVFFRNRSEEV